MTATHPPNQSPVVSTQTGRPPFTVLCIVGTRPEAVKMAPVIQALAAQPALRSLVCTTAQHREMLDQVFSIFDIRPAVDLNLMQPNQTLPALTALAVTGISQTLHDLKPDLVLVQGDTTTALAAGLASYYAQIPLGHVEAGLRTYRRYSPFPEEMNRRLLSALAAMHFAPTTHAVEALQAEGIAANDIYLTGNTVVDALLSIAAQPFTPSAALLSRLAASGERRLLLVTAHRRENFGAPLVAICLALRQIVEHNPDVQLVYPVHLNPQVRQPVFRLLSGHDRIHLIEPVEYRTLIYLLKRCTLVLTDSGGIQEEAPVLGKPVLVLRRDTERPEGIEAGAARLVGVEQAAIVHETERLLHDAEAYRVMAQTTSPYGDGQAARRIVAAIVNRFGITTSENA